MQKNTALDIAEYYSRMQIETASKSKAIYMLHERCVFLLLKAQSVYDNKSFCKIKAQNILSQLQSSLIITDSISRGLFYLYDYCYICLEHDDDDAIANVLKIMNILRDAFLKLSRQQ